MRRAARIDANQHAIVEALRDAGCTVESLAAVGRGVPDLLVGVKVTRDPLLELLRECEWVNGSDYSDHNTCPVCEEYEKDGHSEGCRFAAVLAYVQMHTAINLLFEVKDGDKPPSKRKLTDAQQTWHVAWRGQVRVVTSVADALAVIKEVTNGNT